MSTSREIKRKRLFCRGARFIFLIATCDLILKSLMCDRFLRRAAESQEQSAEQQQLKGGSEHLQPAGRFAFAKW